MNLDEHYIAPPKSTEAGPASRISVAEGGLVRALPRVFGWRAVPGASRYRVIERDMTTGKPRRVYNGAANRAPLEATRERIFRVDALIDGETEYHTIVPFFGFANSSEAGVVIEAPDAGEDATAWRLVVVDRDTAQRVLDQAGPAPAFHLDAGLLAAERRLRYRLFHWRWREGSWQALGPYVALDMPAVPATPVPEETARPQPGGLTVLFTIDTEANLRFMETPDRGTAVERQIFGRWQGREVGIGLIMDQLERRGMRGTFFLDILGELQFGRAAIEDTIEAVQSRGHDVQLHLHPSPHLAYAGDEKLFDLCLALNRSGSPEAFKRALGIAVELFVKRVGRDPIAFRNGAYHIDDRYFEILRAAGIRFDTTVYAFKNCRASPWIRSRTRPFEVIPGLWEIPVSWTLTRPRERDASIAVSQYTARKGSALRRLEQCCAALADAPGPGNFLVTMLHSYTYLAEAKSAEPRAWERWNRRLESLVPAPTYPYLRRSAGVDCSFHAGIDEERIGAIERLLDHLQQTAGTTVVAFDSLHLAKAAPVPLGTSEAGFEPVAEFGVASDRARIAGIRRYGRDYLEFVDRRAEGAP